MDLIEGRYRVGSVSRPTARRQFQFGLCTVAVLAMALVTTALAGLSAYQGQTTYWNHRTHKPTTLARS
ncbi:hypothetical protein [Labrys neptuniae]